MPPSATWSRVLEEVGKIEREAQGKPQVPGQPSALDIYRRGKIAAVENATGRPLIVYATACTAAGKRLPGDMLMIDFSDKIGFQTVTQGIAGPNLDILIHSPGGYPEAAETLVQQLRSKFSSIRFMVPSLAKSAATMMVMSGNEIIMDPNAELGPIDPQFRTQNGTSLAVAVLEQFKKAQEEIKNDPSKLSSWMPILAPLGPSLLVDCQHAIDLAKTLVKKWIETYMLAEDPEAPTKASRDPPAHRW